MMESMRKGDVVAVPRRGGLGGLLLDGGVEGNAQVCPDLRDCPPLEPPEAEAPIAENAQVCPDLRDCPPLGGPSGGALK